MRVGSDLQRPVREARDQAAYLRHYCCCFDADYNDGKKKVGHIIWYGTNKGTGIPVVGKKDAAPSMPPPP